MIIDLNGRHRSVRLIDEERKILDEKVSALSSEEQKFFWGLFEEAEKGNLLRHQQTQQIDYETTPVDVETFLRDDHFLGRSGKNLYPLLMDDMIELFEGDYSEAILTGSLGWGKCVDLATEIYDTKNGRRVTAGELIGEKRFSVPAFYDSSGWIKSCNAVAERSGVKQCVLLELNGGQWIILSVDHPVFTQRGWVEVGHLSLNDLVAVPRKLPSPESFFSVPDDEVKLVAYLCADGSCTGCTPSFTNMNPTLMGEWSGIATELFKQASPNWKHPGVKEVSIGSSGMAKTYSGRGLQWILDKYGLRDLSKDKRIPSEFYGLPDDQVVLFLNRFWACDGSVYHNKSPLKIEVGLASEGLIDDLRFLLLRLGIQSRKSKGQKAYMLPDGSKKSFSAWRLQVADVSGILKFLDVVGDVFGKEEECKKLRRACNGMRSNTNVDVVPVGPSELREIRRELREDDKWRSGMGKDKLLYGTKGQRYSRSTFKLLCDKTGYSGKYSWMATSDILWEQVNRIEHVGEREVCDLSVPGPKSFVGNLVVLHNTYFASLATLYVIYQMSCLRHPQEVYGIDEGSWITLSMVSINEKTARRAVFSELVTKLERSPYFQEKFPYKRYWIEVRFTRKPIMIVAGSTQSNAILSLNIFGGIVDEANFMGQVKTVKRRGSQVRFGGTDRAEVIYNAIIRRMKSRFMRSGKVPGILFLPSSKDVVSSFTEQRIRESSDDSTIFVRDYNTWMIRRKHFMNSPTFKVLVGSERINSRILEPGEEVEYEDVEGIKIIDIPEDYRPDFERNLEDAIREIAGESIFGVSLFFQRLDKIEEMCQAGDKAGLMHPFSVYEWQTDKPGEFAWDRICKRITHRLPGGYTEEGWEPIRNPEAPRHVRLDPSLTGDCTGVAVGHVAAWSEVVRRDEKGVEYNELAPNIIVDFILRVVPPVGDEILLGDIRSLIYQLTEHGFNIRFASSDQFQSADTKQKFIQRGIKAKISSTDKDRQMFQTLKVTIYEGRVLCYSYPVLVEELKRLEYDPVTGKVDHPKDGCFVGETRVALTDGSFPVMQELVGKEVQLYSSLNDGTFVSASGKIRLTKYADRLVDVVLGSGQVERCTPEHTWRLQDGSYREAQLLRSGTDYLMTTMRESMGGESDLNSTIIAVRPVVLDKPIPVYDIDVSGEPNFVLASGVVVHNSKDVADALAGLVFHLTMEETYTPIAPTMGKQPFPDESDDSWATEGWKPVKTERSNFATTQVDGVDIKMPPMPFVKK